MPSSVLFRPKPSKKLWVARALGLTLVAAFSVLGAVWSDRSMDLPWGSDDNARVGFYGNTLPTHWVCSEGHAHYSAPFWAGALFFAIPTALLWFAWPRRRAAPPPQPNPR